MKNTKIYLIAVLLIFSCSLVMATDKKHTRLKAKADRFFDNFIYSKAVSVYEKALNEAENFDAYSHLQIADSYRLMNQPLSAEKWYEKVETNPILTDQDKMNYAQILLKNGKNEKAKQIIDGINDKENISLARFEAIENINSYYVDSMAYFIENMNINSEEADFSPTYYMDGFVFVSNRKNKKLKQTTYSWDDTYFLDLYYSPIVDGQNQVPEAMSKRINTIFHEGPASFYDNGNKVIFTRNNFNLGKTRTSVEGVNMLKLFYAEKNPKSRKWTKPVQLPFNSDDYSVGHPTLSHDGNTLYFSSDMKGTYGKADIYSIQKDGDGWGTPQNLGKIINTSEDEIFPYISSDNILYFSSSGHSGIGGLDVYKVDLKEENPVVINMGYPINTSNDDFSLVLENNTGYLASNRDGGKGNDDIYKINIFEFDIIANLIDAESKELVVGKFDVIDIRTNEIVASVMNGSTTQFKSIKGRELKLVGSCENYLDNELIFSTLSIPAGNFSYTINLPLKKPNLKTNMLIVRNYGKNDQVFNLFEGIEEFEGNVEELKTDLKEKRIDLEETFYINGVYYDFDKYDIRDDAAKELDKLATYLKKYEDLKVTLGSHTDSRGSNSYNEKLAKKRANSAKQYLIAAGIDESRLTVKHFGEKQLIVDCEDSDECNENQHQLNRRTEIILSK